MKLLTREQATAGAFVFALAATFLILLLIAVFGVSPVLTWNWLGEGGIAGALLGAGTLGAAVTAAWLAWRNYVAGQLKDINERFLRGVELVEEGSTARRTAGIIVLEDLAMEPGSGRQRRWTLEFLASAISTWSADRRGRLPSVIPPDHKFQKTDEATLRAFKTLSRLDDETGESRRISYLYLSDATISDLTIDGFDISSTHVIDTWFQHCSMQRFGLRGRFVGDVTFIDCDLSNSRLRAVPTTSAKKADIDIAECNLSYCHINVPRGSELTLSACKVDGLIIRGSGTIRANDCWFRELPPDFGRWNTFEGITVFHATHQTHKLTDRGWKVWTPTADDRPLSKPDLNTFPRGVFS